MVIITVAIVPRCRYKKMVSVMKTGSDVVAETNNNVDECLPADSQALCRPPLNGNGSDSGTVQPTLSGDVPATSLRRPGDVSATSRRRPGDVSATSRRSPGDVQPTFSGLIKICAKNVG